MCGIAGIMTRDGSAPDPKAIEKFREAVHHRGPDGNGIHRSGSLAMIQTRLAVIDLETGDQPLYEPRGAALVSMGDQQPPLAAFANSSVTTAP